MTTEKIRKKFLTFFAKQKKLEHTIVESSTLWPQDDPSVLLTTAGMQQFKPYFAGDKDVMVDFKNKRLASVQRCFRTSDIESVGDASHATFFEMLGNFSIGDYFKPEAIDLAWQFLTKELKLDPDRLWATYFSGDDEVKKDEETLKLWQKYLPTERIIGFGRQENWWGPTGDAGPCGPSSEIHYDFVGSGEGQPNDESGRFMEVWNLVFTEFHMYKNKKLKSLPAKNIDTGMGLERLALIVQSKSAIADLDVNQPIEQLVQADKNFGSTTAQEDALRSRIVTDHIKGTIFLLADGIVFSNKEQGYVARRIFRRALDQYLFPHFAFEPLVDGVIKIYGSDYPYLATQRNDIIKKLNGEAEAYQKVLSLDIDETVVKIQKAPHHTNAPQRLGPSSRQLSAEEAFTLYSTYGLSADRLKRKGYSFDEQKFNQAVTRHQEASRAASESKFGGHGLNSSELTAEERSIMTQYHTATHLLHQALRDVLGPHVRQQGSDITPDRLRFDFEHSSKMTDEEKNKVEELVNKKINEELPVTHEEMDYDAALKAGALAFFKEKYGKRVSVYSIGDYSKELCGGPHVTNTREIGPFSIISEKSSAAGIRRIKAVIEKKT